MQPLSTEIITITSVLISSIIGPFIVEFFKKKLEKKIDLIHENLKLNIVVENKVEEIREEFNADRVYIIQFHNGGQFFPSGKSMKKFSIFYESINDDTSSVIQQFQNIPISLFSKSLNQLYTNDVISIPDFSNPNIENYGLKNVSEENHNKSSYLFAIKSIDGKLIGILGLNYVKTPVLLNQQKINQLANEATAIGGVLLNPTKK